MEIKNEKKIELFLSPNFLWKAAIIVLAIFFVYLIRNILILLFLAFIGVSATQPFVDKMETKKIPRALTAVFIFAILFLILGAILYAIVPVFVFEVKEFGKNSSGYFEKLNNLIPAVTENAESNKSYFNPENILENLSSKIADSISGIFSNAFSFLKNFLSLAVVFSLSFYMLVKKDGIQGFLRMIVPHKNRAYIFNLVTRIQASMGRWLIGQMTLILIIFCLDYLVLYLLNVPYALVLASFGGILEIIPYIGPVLSVIPAVLVGLTVSPFTALLVIICYIIVQQIENNIIVPLIMKKAVGLDPVIIILALLIGATLFGFLGVLAAVPAAAALSIFLKDFLEKKI